MLTSLNKRMYGIKKTSRNILASLILVLASFTAFAATVDTITIYSQAMNKDSKAVVVLPYSYTQNEANTFPVVYLLHGYSGDYANWIKKVPKIKQYADQFQLIIVCPDAQNSWYIDSKHINSSVYETYIGTEIPKFIDSAYRTIPERDSRAICGLSMGGHGALYLGIRHQDIFGAAGSMSGVLDLAPWRSKYGIENIIGDTTISVINGYSVINLIKNTKISIPLIIDCGISDPFIEANRRTHEQLILEKIPHDYTERFGGHTWDYWSNAIGYQLLFFRKFFEKGLM